MKKSAPKKKRAKSKPLAIAALVSGMRNLTLIDTNMKEKWS